MTKDKLWNGTLIGAGAGVLAIFVPKIQEMVLGWMPEPYNTMMYSVLVFAGLGALIGLIADKY